jgi:voltage-gated potassium channel
MPPHDDSPRAPTAPTASARADDCAPRDARARLHALLESPAPTSRAAHRLRVGIAALIVVSTAAAVAETMPSVHHRMGGALLAVELVAGAAFTLEYLLRLYACTADPEYRHPVLGRLRFAARPLMLLDLLAVLPFFLAPVANELRIVRILRLLRVLRLAKLGRYSTALGTLGRVARARSADLTASLSLVLTLLLLAACMMYAAERDAQPDAFGSIPDAMWWAAMTVTTVGYGDVYPTTSLGRVLGATTAVLGIALFALPTSILAAEFLDELQRRRAHPCCPHCGLPLDDAGGPAAVAPATTTAPADDEPAGRAS